MPACLLDNQTDDGRRTKDSGQRY